MGIIMLCFCSKSIIFFVVLCFVMEILGRAEKDSKI